MAKKRLGGRGSRRAWNGVEGLLLLATCTIGSVACGPPQEETTDTPPAPTEVGTERQAILGGQSYNSCTTPERLALRNVATIGRTVASSPGLASCVRFLMTHNELGYGPYRPFDDDPSGGADSVIARARSRTPMAITCSDKVTSDGALGEAGIGNPGHSGPDAMSISNKYVNEIIAGQGEDVAINDPVAVLWHEGMHTQGYGHKVIKEFLVNTPGYTDTIPVIVQRCMQQVRRNSPDLCGSHGKIFDPDAVVGDLPIQGVTCEAGELPIMSSYPNPTSCTCVRDAVQGAASTQDRPSPILETNEAGDEYGAAIASGDFDGDGNFDVAVGAPGESPSVFPPSTGQGYVYGRAGDESGLFPRQTVAADVPLGSGARFGTAMAAGDFNGDGYDDLAVGAPAFGGTGRVFLFYGNELGLSPAGWIDRGTLGQSTPGGMFGQTLAVRRSSGNTGLVVGAPGEVVNGSASGAVYVYAGVAGVPGALLKPVVKLTQSGLDADEPGDRFGAALAAGRIVNGLSDDLAIGAPGEDGSVGRVYVFLSTSDGGLTGGPVLFAPAPVLSLSTGLFGSSVAIGRFVDRNFGSVAIGEPYGGPFISGAVHIYDGERIIPEPAPAARRRLTLIGSAVGSLLGTALTQLPMDAPFDDLAIGSPGIPGFALGQVPVYSGTDNTMTLRETVTQPPMGIDEPGDRFGEAMGFVMVRKGEDPFPDRALVVGAPGEAPGLEPQSGAAFLYNDAHYFVDGPTDLITAHHYLGWQTLDQED